MLHRKRVNEVTGRITDPSYATVWEYCKLRALDWDEKRMEELAYLARQRCTQTRTKLTRRRGDGPKKGSMVAGYPVKVLDAVRPQVA